MQAIQYLTWVKENKLRIRGSEKDRSVRYYVINGLEIYNDVVLGRNIRVVEATGISQTDYLDMYANEGSIVIVETEHGYEYCGIVHNGARTGIYIRHMPIELENIDITWCPTRSEVQFITEDLMMRGLSVASPIMNPWVDIVPYVLYTLRKFGYRINLGE